MTLLCLEVATRVFAPQQESMRWFMPSQRYGHLLYPSFHQSYPFGREFVMDVKTNSDGLRDEEIEAEKPGEKTLLLIGDSFTFGHAVNIEDRMDTFLEQGVREEGLPLRIVNAGVGGWGTIQATRFAEDNFERFSPDIIGYTFCGNDPTDDAYFLKKGQSFDEIRFPGKTFLRNHSHLFRYVTHQAFLILHARYVKQELQKKPDQQLNKQSGSLLSDNQWDSTRSRILAFYHAFKTYNPDGVLLLQAADPLESNISANLRVLDNGKDLIYIDLEPAADALSPKARRLPWDGHWSPAMHKAAADTLLNWLKDTKLTRP